MKWEWLLEKRFPFAPYEVDIPWSFLEDTLKRYKDAYQLDLDPDFQRAHVWTEDQQIAYVEWVLLGGRSGKNIYFNCDWFKHGKFIEQMVLVDGKQRIQAVRRFLRNEIPALGYYLNAMECKDIIGRSMDLSFRFHIHNLKTRKEVLGWYLFMNTGGTDHTQEEINKVKKLLDIESRGK